VPERAPLIKRVTSDELRPDEVVTLREMFDVAWGDGEERFTTRTGSMPSAASTSSSK